MMLPRLPVLATVALLAGMSVFGHPRNASAQSPGEGLIVMTSSFGATKTLDRLGIALQRAGITVFARIKHHTGARKAGLTLRPTEVMIFGTAKLGTPLMQSNAAIGLDLPLRAVAWEDAAGVTHLAYTDPAVLKARYAIAGRDKVFATMAGALRKFTAMATTKGALKAVPAK